MTAKQEAKLNMYRTVQLHCNNNSAITATNPAFTAAIAVLSAKISTIISTLSAWSQVITGIATDKTVAKKNLSQSATDVAALAYAYAVSINNNTLAEQVKYTFSDFYRLKDDLIAPTAQNIHNAATANLPALATYGVTPALLTALQTIITNYSSSVPKPRNANAIKATYTQNIRELMKETDALLKNQLDKLAVSFKTTQPDFYSTFFNARIIVDPSKTETQIKGMIVDALTNAPIVKATVQVVGASTSTKLTDAEGKFVFKPLPPGTYELKVSVTGYVGINILVDLKLGQALNQNLTLMAA